MGSLCSKSSTHSGSHAVLGGGEAGAVHTSPRNETPDERRERMLRAVEDRQRKDTERLTNKANPNAGRLASQVNKPYKPTPSQREDEILRWD